MSAALHPFLVIPPPAAATVAGPGAVRETSAP